MVAAAGEAGIKAVRALSGRQETPPVLIFLITVAGLP
jgi:hypothetical protein